MSSSNPTHGECKLCHATGELRDSHFIPKAAYKIIKESQGESPVVVNAEVSLQTDNQIEGLCPLSAMRRTIQQKRRKMSGEVLF